MPITLTEDFAEVTLGPLTISNNTWGVDTWGFSHWVNGRDYRQSMTYTPGNLAQGLKFDWSYTNPGGNILAYPEIILGYKPWSLAGDDFLVGQIDSLRDLRTTTSIDIRGQTDGFNIAYDLWLTDQPKGDYHSITAEVMVWLHPGGFTAAGEPSARISTDSFQASVYFLPDMAAGTDESWAYIAVVIDGGHLDGTLDLREILHLLADKGFVSRSDYLSSVELGAEVQTGTGGYTLHDFRWSHSEYRVTAGADTLTGTGLADRIWGKGGADRLAGLAGDDRLSGGDGADSLSGGDGADRLWGGAGADRLTGGRDADRFIFARSDHAMGDRITDFSHAQGDRIDLSVIDANRLTGAADAFRFIGSAAFSHRAGELRVQQADGQTLITADTNGDARSDFTIVLNGLHSLTAADFVL